MRVPEEPVCIDLFRQNPVFTSLHLKYPVHVVPPQDNARRYHQHGAAGEVNPAEIPLSTGDENIGKNCQSNLRYELALAFPNPNCLSDDHISLAPISIYISSLTVRVSGSRSMFLLAQLGQLPN
jgi:hypothetical protein